MQGDDIEVVRAGQCTAAGDRVVDLAHAGHEAEDVSGGAWQQLADRVDHSFARRIFHRQRMQGAGHIDDRAVAEECRHRRRLERGRHHEDAEVGSRQPRLPRQCQSQIGVHAALVKLVDDQRAYVAQQRIVLQIRGEDAFGDDDEPGFAGELAVKTDVPADLASYGPVAFLGDAARHRARSKPPRLQQQHPPTIHQRRRDSRCLAGARSGGKHSRTMLIERGPDRAGEGINRERRRHGVSSKLTRNRQGYPLSVSWQLAVCRLAVCWIERVPGT